uniref:Uncharacterized protein n=1 Tax=Avena sativa TaxID=4498 RepID=A0ACD5VR72_AVESA
MGSVGGEEEFPAGVTGADAEVGALVWVRRRNGSWWPGRILGQDELPENCVVPPRSAGTPIKLLGRPDGSIDWYNLEKSKRVKAFRCGEYEECIEKAKLLARQQKRTYNEGKYVRREDAILHALEIERSRFPDEDGDDATCASQNTYFAKSKNKRSSHVERDMYGIEENSAQRLSQASLFKLPQNISSSSTRYASSSRKKRKASKKFQDDTVKGFRRMRDLIGSNKVPKQKSGAGSFSNGYQDLPLFQSGSSFGYELSSTNGINKSNQSSHSLTKRKRSNIVQAYENSRKKDRRRPLSKLCEDSPLTVPSYWDPSGQSSVRYPGRKLSSVFESNRGESAFSENVNCSYSSGASSVETLADTLCIDRSAAKAFQLKGDEVLDGTGFHNDGYSDDDEFLDAPFTMEEVVTAEGHLHTRGSCTSVKDEILKHSTQITDYNKERIPPLHGNTSSKNRNIQVTPVSCNTNKNSLVQQYKGTIKCKEQDEDVTGLEARVGSASLCKPTDLGNNMKFVLVLPDVGAGVMGQQYAESGPEHDASSETLSNHSYSGKVKTAPPYYGSPLQVILPEQKPVMKSTRCPVVKPIKSVRTDYKLYDVELAAEGTYKGHRAPLVSLMSQWNRKPVLGYPLPVVVLDDSCPVESRDNHHLASSSLNHLLKSEAAEPRQQRSSHASRSKFSGRKKASEHDMDKSWRPHTKKSESSPRKMRRLSSFASSRRDSAKRNTLVRKNGGSTIACIPVRLVFSRINEALSFPVRSKNPT